MHLPSPVRAAVGLVATAADEARRLPDRAVEVAAIARGALAAPVVQRALAAPRHWRELAVVAEVDGRR